jgi:hypothetical protein
VRWRGLATFGRSRCKDPTGKRHIGRAQPKTHAQRRANFQANRLQVSDKLSILARKIPDDADQRIFIHLRQDYKIRRYFLEGRQ